MKEILFLLLSAISLNANAEVISLITVSNPPECKADHYCDITSHHEIHVINAGTTPETLGYSYHLCINGICDNAQNIVTVYPGQHWDNSRNGKIHVKFREGKYDYSVITECGQEKKINIYTIKVK